jgi:hypothetical protein
MLADARWLLACFASSGLHCIQLAQIIDFLIQQIL